MEDKKMLSSEAHIDKIPTELLTYIWSYVDSDTAGAPFVLSSVCTQWRSLALATPPLWAKILLVMEFQHVNPELSLRLERSGQALLTVRVIRCSRAVFEVIGEHADRWATLYTEEERAFELVSSHLLARTKQLSYDPRANQMKDVTLNFGFTSRNAELHVDYRIWPNLTSLSITCPILTTYLPLFPPALKELSLSCRNLTLSSLSVLLASCPDLESLLISAMHFRRDVPDSQLPALLKLRELTLLSSYILERLLLSSPQLQSLVLKPQLLAEQAIFPSVKTSITTNLTSLRIHIKSRLTDGGKADLVALLLHSPSIERLTIIGSKVLPFLLDIKYLFPSMTSLALKYLELKFVTFDYSCLRDVVKRMDGADPRCVLARVVLVGCEGVSAEEAARLRGEMGKTKIDYFLSQRSPGSMISDP